MKGERKVKAIYIHSLEDYIKAINNNCLIDEKYLLGTDGNTIDMTEKPKLDEVWFRGEPNCYKYVLPSLFRDFSRANLEDENYRKPFDYVADENKLINKALQYYPQLFEHCKSGIEQLVTMQHYLLPTRLLDVTKNPLVALFVACQKGDKEDDGRVLFINNKELCINQKLLNSLYQLIVKVRGVNEFESFPFSIICKLIDADNKMDIYEKRAFFMALTNSILFLPRYDNDRIKHQQGALIFSALFSPAKVSKEECNAINEKIIKEFTIGPLEAEIEEKMDTIRFCKTLCRLDDQFSKIVFIISEDSKSNLLKELDNYGINEAFVYPEPEHQMKYVNWYCTNHKY